MSFLDSMFGEDGESSGMSLFQNVFPDIDFLERDGYTVRGDTIVWLKNEILVDRHTRRIVSDMIHYLKHGKRKGYGRHNATNKILKEIKKVVDKNLNLQITLAGKTGSGKSETAQKLAFVQRDEYHKFAKENPEHPKAKEYATSTVKVGFKAYECNSIASEMSSGDILIRDEKSSSSGEGSDIEDQANENLKKAVRGKNINFYDCQPKIEFSETTNYTVVAIGFHEETKIGLSLVFVPFSGTKASSIVLACIGYLITTIHNHDDFRRDYERRKAKYIDDLLELGGIETVEAKIQQIKEHAEKLINYIKNDYEKYPDNLSEWDLVYDLANIPKLSSKYPRKVIEYSKKQLTKDRDFKNSNNGDTIESDMESLEDMLENYQGDPFKSFEFDPIKEMDKMDNVSPRDKKIYEMNLNPSYTQSKISSHPEIVRLNGGEELSPARVSQITQEVQGKIDYVMGHKFEDFAKLVYEKELGYEILYFSEKRLQDDPDLIVEKDGIIEVISLKSSMSKRKEVKPKDKCKPELKEWITRKRNGEEAKCYLEFVNIQPSGVIHRKIEIDDQNYKMSFKLL